MLPDMLKCVLLHISLIILPTKSVSLEIYKEKLLQHELVCVQGKGRTTLIEILLDSLKED